MTEQEEKDLAKEVLRLFKRVDAEHENFLAAHRDNMKAALRIDELKKELERYRAALEKIAKPALGGKQQQWIAQEALNLESQGRGA